MDSTVSFNGVTASVVSWSDTQIVATVPDAATSGMDVITVKGAGSYPVVFTVVPQVTGIDPSTAPEGAQITVNGSGFGAAQGGNTVTFNGLSAEVVSSTPDQIVVTVPPSVTTGPVAVMVNDISSNNDVIFTAQPALAQVVDSLGNQSTYRSSVIGGKQYVTDSTGTGCASCTIRGTIHNIFDNYGNLLSTTDALGHTTSYTYDSFGNVTSQSVALDANTTATSSFTYNSFSEALTVTDPLGNTTTNAYDSKGNLLSVTSPAPNGSTAPR